MRGGNRLSLVVLLNNRTTVGGGELAVYRYAASLARRGHRVTVFANWRNDFMRKARPAGMRVRFRRGLPPSIRASGRFNRWWARMYGRLFIEPCLLGEKPDFICGYLRQAAADAWRYGRKYGIRVVNFVFETPDLVMRELGDILPPAEAARLRRQWDAVRQAYREAAVLVPLSETVRQECARWTGRPVAPPVYLGVDADEAIKHPASDEHIVYVGRLDVYKNVQDLIRATARLPDPPPLVIAGSGYEERDLRRLAVNLE
ncbi:MAG TPA: hypothetical protein EYP62_02775 [Kiritimatiellae bacterium]|nr:hypothetical protein [Kiritimatiellia bacterium]